MSAPLLEINGWRARYGRVEVLHGIDLVVHEGEKVVLLGPNGAGKTTLLRAISRTVRTTGGIRFAGKDLNGVPAPVVARLGIGHVPSGRGTFGELTVLENLRLGVLARGRRAADKRAVDLERLLAVFPALDEFRHRRAGALSGGHQQMLALARVLLTRPRLLLVDEPSLGLAPLVIKELFGTLAALQVEWGMTLLLAEQNARMSLSLADRAYLLAGGRVAHAGAVGEIAADVLHAAYLASRPGEGKP